ncbi:DNA primase catalytic subunit PriS [Methanocaldococcus sp. 10A]
MNTFVEVQKLYKEYYSFAIKNNILEVPDCIEYREFGYGYLNKVDNRNLSFKNEREYKDWVLKNAPMHLYKSLAYMLYPNKSGGAAKKGIFRRELAFDIDVHKTKKCKHDEDWICKHCLEEAKNQAIYLIEEFLIPDFGLNEEDLKIVFSGNRGYHIYIKPKDEEIRNIIENYSKEDRRFLMSYILGENLNLNSVGSGWRRRLTKAIKEKDKRISTKKLEKEKNWKKVIDNLKSKNKIYNIIEKTKNKLELDEKVMDDDIRLLRVINSLHGYTGFIVKPLSNLEELKKFNPLEDAVFKNFENKSYEVNIYDNRKFEIEICGKKYNNNSKKITGSALLYLFGHNIKFEILN